MATWKGAVVAVGVTLLAAACGSVAPGSTPAAKTTPAQSTAAASTATPATAPRAQELARSSLLSTSWINANDGWALAAQPCGKSSCARLARTTDAGLHWQVLPNPAGRIQDSTVNCAQQACVSQVSFASPNVGYLYGPASMMTTDGGLTWHVEHGPQIETLTIAGGQVYRVAYTSGGCPGPCQPSLQEAAIGSANWRTLIGTLNEPGRSDSAQVAASGPDELVAMYGSLAGPIPAAAIVYRSTDGGGTWRQTADPCAGLGPNGSRQRPNQEEDLIGLASAADGFFAGMCGPHNMMNTFVITSADGGATWHATAAPPPGQWLGFVAAASPATLAVASGAMSGNGTTTARLLLTTDGGRHWVTAATDTQNLPAPDIAMGTAPAWLGFETPLAGQWLGDPHGIWTTTDGGLRWIRTAFG
jgi:hypothetical protein